MINSVGQKYYLHGRFSQLRLLVNYAAELVEVNLQLTFNCSSDGSFQPLPVGDLPTKYIPHLDVYLQFRTGNVSRSVGRSTYSWMLAK